MGYMDYMSALGLLDISASRRGEKKKKKPTLAAQHQAREVGAGSSRYQTGITSSSESLGHALPRWSCILLDFPPRGRNLPQLATQLATYQTARLKELGSRECLSSPATASGLS